MRRRFPFGISTRFQALSPSDRQVTHVLLTRPPLPRSPKGPQALDLHVLGTPPAFVLSQDQTLSDRGVVILRIRAGAQRSIERPTKASDARSGSTAPASRTASRLPRCMRISALALRVSQRHRFAWLFYTCLVFKDPSPKTRVLPAFFGLCRRGFACAPPERQEVI